MGLGQGAGGGPAIGVVADVDDPPDAHVSRALEHLGPIGVEGRIVEVGVRVDDLNRHGAHFTVTLLARFRGRSGSLPRASAAW